MKYAITLLAFFGLAVVPAAAQNLLLPLLADSSHWYIYDGSGNGNQVGSSKTYWYYNADHQETSSLTKIYEYLSVPRYLRDTTDYDAQGRRVRYTSFLSTWGPTGPWGKLYKVEYEYDAQNRLEHVSGEKGDGAVWIPNYDITYSFDDTAHTTNKLYVRWNTNIQQWVNYYREFTKYTPDGKIIEFKRDEWDSNANEWKNSRIEKYDYQPDDRLLSKHFFQETSNGIYLYLIDSFTYRPDGLLDSTFKIYTNELYVASYFYDAGDQLDSILSVISEDDGLSFSPYSRNYLEPGDGYYSNDYTYDAFEQFANGAYETKWTTTKVFTPLDNDRVLYEETYWQGNPLKLNDIDSIWYRTPDAVYTGAPMATPSCSCQLVNPFRSGQAIRCETADTRSALTYRLTDLNSRVLAAGTTLPGTPWRPALQAAEGVYLLSVWQKGVFLGSRKLILTN